MNLPHPFEKASDVKANIDGTISLVDDQGNSLARLPLITAFELSPEVKGSGFGFGFGFSHGSGYGYGFGDGYGSGSGSGSGDGFGHGFGYGYGDGSGRSK